MSSTRTEYHPEPYWSDVAKRIAVRQGNNVIAGDDEPYYRYKRQRFLRLLNSVAFKDKSVLEVGCGPGGNLLEVLKHSPASLTGVDISEDMIALAGQSLDLNLTGSKTKVPVVNLFKIDGLKLPFEDDHFDIVFTATVLQHNTDADMLAAILQEICRVSRSKVILLERIEKSEKGDELCMGRPVSHYESICAQKGYRLKEVDFINTRVSYYVSGAIRKVFNKEDRREGEAITPFSASLQKATLPLTRQLDKVFTSPTDVAKLVFTKDEPAK